jgi:hypothetical protein
MAGLLTAGYVGPCRRKGPWFAREFRAEVNHSDQFLRWLTPEMPIPSFTLSSNFFGSKRQEDFLKTERKVE